MSGAYFAVFHILYDVHIDVLPIYFFSGKVLHHLDAFMAFVEFSKHSLV